MLTAIPSFSGTVFLEITSAEPEKTIQELILADISVSEIQKESPLCYRFLVFQKDFSLKRITVRKAVAKISLMIVQQRELGQFIYNLPLSIIGYIIQPQAVQNNLIRNRDSQLTEHSDGDKYFFDICFFGPFASASLKTFFLSNLT